MQRLFALIFVFFSVASASAECIGRNLIEVLSDKERATLASQIAVHPYPSGNLWRAERGTSVVHVVGTMHLDDPRHAPLRNTVQPLIEAADALYVEMTREGTTELLHAISLDPSIISITEGPTLVDLLPEDDWATLVDDMAERGVPSFMVAKMQPWYVTTMLGVPPCAAREVSAQNGLDFQLMDIAQGASTPVHALESAWQTLQLFSMDPFEDQLSDLQYSLQFLGSNQRDGLVTMLESYFAGNHREGWEASIQAARPLDRTLQEGYDAMVGEFEQELLIDRNQAWMELLLPEIESGTYVVAVGAAHLSGTEGILQQLEIAGYQMTRIEISPE